MEDIAKYVLDEAGKDKDKFILPESRCIRVDDVEVCPMHHSLSFVESAILCKSISIGFWSPFALVSLRHLHLRGQHQREASPPRNRIHHKFLRRFRGRAASPREPLSPPPRLHSLPSRQLRNRSFHGLLRTRFHGFHVSMACNDRRFSFCPTRSSCCWCLAVFAYYSPCWFREAKMYRFFTEFE